MKWSSFILVIISLSSCITLSVGGGASTNPIQHAVGYYSNGKLKFKGEHLNGYRHGTWTDWNGNGDTISIINYNQGELNGSFKIWELEKKYEDDSKATSDYAVDYGEILIKQGHYLGGKLHGGYKEYFSSGELKCNGFYNKGREEGEWIRLKISGDTLNIINYSFGQKKGVFTIWSYYSHEVLTDAKRSLVDIKHQGIYKFNMLNGNYVESFPNGTVRCSGAYVDNNREGEWIWYYNTGVIKEIATYSLGRLISSKKFDKEGY